jgi:carbamoyltransferase
MTTGLRERPVVVGLNVGHDGGCVVVAGGSPICGVSEERLNRHRFSPGWAQSLLYVLSEADIRIADVDLFVFSSGGPDLPEGFDGGLHRLGVDPRRVITLDHHASHAWSAHCLSGARQSTVLIVDAVGNNDDTESWWSADESGLRRLGRNPENRPRAGGIGSTYEAFTNWLGFPDQESGKTMALAAYGDAAAFSAQLFDIDGFDVFGGLGTLHQWGVDDFGRDRGMAFGEAFPNSRSERAANVAAYVQSHTEQVVVELAKRVLASYPANTFCFAGGVALNCVLNSRLRDELAPCQIFVPPAASDVGQPLGNAFFGHWHLTNEMPSGAPHYGWLGRSYSQEDIRDALAGSPRMTTYGGLRRSRWHATHEQDPAETAAQLLADGKIVGWVRAGSEFGPRALGHRSILADPRTEESRDHLNSKIKHREWFRPFAPMIAAEYATEILGRSLELPYMLEAPRVEEHWRTRIAGAVHVDGTARVQTLSKEADPTLHRLIDRFAHRTGVPVLLNTSFNDREPIVETPGDALATYLSGEIDALLLEDTLVLKDD